MACLVAALSLGGCAADAGISELGVTCASLHEGTRADGSVVVGGDLRFADLEDARAYLELIAPDPDLVRARLTVATDGLAIASLPEEIRDDVTYCVSDAFGEDRAAVVQGLQTAMSIWSSAADVHFRLVAPARCEVRGEDAHLVVFPTCLEPGDARIAEGMLPWRRGREGQDLTMNTCHADWLSFVASEDALARIALHELGHILGFVHAWQARDYVGVCRCQSVTAFLELGAYDRDSIMNYPTCGAPWTLFDPPALSEADRRGAAQIYCDADSTWPPCAE